MAPPPPTGFLTTQVDLERHAVRLLDRPDVRQALTALADRWQAGTPGLLPETYAQLRPSLEEVALLVALQVANDDARRPRVVEISAGPHTWGGFAVPGGRWGINNPDTLYFHAPLEPGSRYVLTGRPRATAPTDVNVSVQVPDVWSTLATIGRDRLTFRADGSFTVTLGDGAADGDHLPIPAGGTVLLVRQTLADWTRELPYDLTLERTDGPAPAPPASDDDRAAQLTARLAVVVDHSLQGLQPPIFTLPPNTIPQPGEPGDKPGYLPAQRNTLGHFRLADDEALVLAVSPGGAGYCSVVAPNVWGVTADSARHGNSLNTRQAVLDDDGRMTVVVSNVDPGVVDWLDPGGLREGILMLRWQLLATDPGANEPPGVTVRPVRVADLPDVLPASVPRLGSAAEREARRAARAAAYARRFTER